MGIPASARLHKPVEFLKVRSLGQRIHCGPFIFQCRCSSKGATPRAGIIASRRVGNAVKRNYGKRVFRELFRKHMPLLPEGSEVVIVLRSGFVDYPFEELERRFLKACKSTHVASKGS